MGSALWVVVALSLAQSPPKSIASPVWKTVQVSPELAGFLSDAMASRLRKHGFRVVTASEIESLLTGERQKQLMGCGEESASCIAELAAALGCDATLLVNLAKLGTLYRGNLKVLSSVNGDVLAEVQVEAPDDAALATQLDAAANRLAASLDPKRTLAPAEVHVAAPVPAAGGGGGTKRFWLVPAVAGGAFLVAGIGSFAFSESTYGRLSADLRANKAISEADVRAGALVQTLGWVGVGVGVAAVAAGVGLLLFGSDAPVAVAVGPHGASVGVAGVFP